MTHIFIINPAAGSRDRTEEYRQAIDAVCGKRGLSYRVEISRFPGDCTRIAREAAQTGEPVRLYACGGDGTLNEVAAGAAGCENAAVTVYSGGSGNDFIKIFDHPEAFFDLEQLMDCRQVTFDMIACNEDLSLNICSVGLDARIGTDMARYKRLPLLGGFRAYVASTVVNLFKRIAEHYVIHINGETLDGKYTFVCVCNGRFYGGGFNPVPEADPADGMLDVLIVRKVNLLQVPGIIGKYKKGQYRRIPKFVTHYRTDRVTVECDRETPINLDGELRRTKTVTMSLAPAKVNFFYPKALTWKQPEPVEMR